MTNRKTLLKLTLALACAAAIVWLGVGCGEEVDPDYPCGQEAVQHADHVRQVFLENSRLFKRQPGFYRAMEHFIRDDEGNWSDDYGIVIGVGEKRVDQDTLPLEDRIPDEIEGVRIFLDDGPRNYTRAGLMEGLFHKEPAMRYASALKWKYIDLLWQHRYFVRIDVGHPVLGYTRGKVGVFVDLDKNLNPRMLPWGRRIPSCLEEVPIEITVRP